MSWLLVDSPQAVHDIHHFNPYFLQLKIKNCIFININKLKTWQIITDYNVSPPEAYATFYCTYQSQHFIKDLISRLHQTNEDTDYCYGCSQCLSISLSRSSSRLHCVKINGWTDQDDVWGEHSWGPMEHCVRRGSWSPNREGKASPVLNFGIPSYLQDGWSYRPEI